MVTFLDDSLSTHEKFAQFALPPPNKKDPHRVRLSAVSSALAEQLRQEQSTGDRTPTGSEYFAVTLTALQSPTSASYTLELLKLFSLAIPETSPGILTSKESELNKVLSRLIISAGVGSDGGKGDDGAPAVTRAALSVVAEYFFRLPSTKSTFARPSTLKIFHLFLSAFSSSSAKIRKHSHSLTSQVLRHHKSNGCYSLSEHVSTFAASVLSKTTANDTTDTLHLMNFLRLSAEDCYNASSVAEIGTQLLGLIKLQNQVLTDHALATLLALTTDSEAGESSMGEGTSAEGTSTKTSAAALQQFLTGSLAALLTSGPTLIKKESSSSSTNYIRLLVVTTHLLLQSSPQTVAKLLPTIVDVITQTMSHPDGQVASSSGAELTKLLRQNLPTLCLGGSHSTGISATIRNLDKLLGYKYQSVYSSVLPVLSALFSLPISVSIFEDTLKKLVDLRVTLSVGGSSKKSSGSGNSKLLPPIDSCIASCVESLGIEQFLAIVPLSIPASPSRGQNAPPIPTERAWLLPLLKTSTPNFDVGGNDDYGNLNGNNKASSNASANTPPPSLAYFHNNILPLARSTDAYSALPSLTPLESSLEKGKVLDLWSLFPTFCRSPSDLPHLEKIVPLLVRGLNDKRYPGLLPVICQGLVLLVGTSTTSSADSSTTSTAADSSTAETLPLVSPLLLPALFTLSNTSNASTSPTNASLINRTISTWATVSPKSLLSTLFKKLMTKLLASMASPTPTSNEAPKEASATANTQQQISTLLSLSLSLLPVLPDSSVSLLYRAVKTLVRSGGSGSTGKQSEGDRSVQKRGYVVLEGILSRDVPAGCPVVGGDKGRKELAELLISTLLTCHVSCRNARLRCLSKIFDPSVKITKELTSLLPQILPEIILCLKDANATTRQTAYDLLVALSTAVPIMDYYQTLLAGYAADTPHMRSAAVMAISRIVFEYRTAANDNAMEGQLSDDDDDEDDQDHGNDRQAATRSILPDLLRTTLLLFRENSREVVKSVVCFVRVCVAAMNSDQLEDLLEDVVQGLLKWNSGKDRFRSKIKIILKKLVRLYGWERVNECVPEGDERLIRHIRKVGEREMRRREREKSTQSDNNNNRRSKSNNDFDGMFESDEDDSDDGRTLVSGMTGMTGLTKRSGMTKASASVRSFATKNSAKSSSNAQGGGGKNTKVQIKSDALDLLDEATMASSVRYTRRGGDDDNYNDDFGDDDDDGDDDDVMEFDGGGRLVVDDDLGKGGGGSKRGDVAGGRGRTKDDSDDGDEDDDDNRRSRPMKYEMEKRKQEEAGSAKRRKLAASRPGASYKSSKAGGDVVKKGHTHQPYAYIPLDGRSYTKKNRRDAVEGFQGVVGGGKGKGKGGKGKGGKRKRGGD